MECTLPPKLKMFVHCLISMQSDSPDCYYITLMCFSWFPPCVRIYAFLDWFNANASRSLQVHPRCSFGNIRYVEEEKSKKPWLSNRMAISCDTECNICGKIVRVRYSHFIPTHNLLFLHLKHYFKVENLSIEYSLQYILDCYFKESYIFVVYRIVPNKRACLNKRAPRPLTFGSCISATIQPI